MGQVNQIVPGGANFANGTYVGNDSNSRQITCGFIPKFVLIYAEEIQSALDGSIMITPDGYLKSTTGGVIVLAVDAGLTIHATDGFLVGQAAGTTYYANRNGITNYYVAIG